MDEAAKNWLQKITSTFNNGMREQFPVPAKVFYVCTGSKCKKNGGKELCKIFRDLAKEHGLKDEVEIIKTDCSDRCKFAPVMSVQPNNVWLHGVHGFQARSIFQQHILQAEKEK